MTKILHRLTPLVFCLFFGLAGISFSTQAMGAEVNLRGEAETALADGDAELALQLYMELLAANPLDTDSLDMAVELADLIDAPELGLQLVLGAVEAAVAAGDKSQVQHMLARIDNLLLALPGWVDQRLTRANEVPEDKMGDLQVWQELSGEAQALMDAGAFDEALPVLEGVLLFAEETFGPKHWSAISALRDTGFAYRQLGLAEEADHFYTQALSLSAEVLGESHPQTQFIAELLAELYSASGATDEAQMMREMVSATYEAELGPANLLTMEARTREVGTFEAAGDYESARRLLGEVCDTYADNYTRYHTRTIDCQIYLARLQRETGSLADAEISLNSVVNAIEASAQGITAQALDALMQLSEVYRDRGQFQYAKDLLSGLITTAQLTGEAEISYTGKTYLARLLVNQADYAGAELLIENVLAHGRKHWGDRPVQYYNVMLELGGIYQQQGRLADAEKVFSQSYEALVNVVGESYPSTLVAMNNLGLNYEQQGLYDEAEPIMKRTVAGMEATFGPAHQQTSHARNNLALLHESQGNFREAEPLYISSRQYLADEFGENHPSVIAVENNLAYLYMMMEEFDSSAQMFEDIVARWNTVLGMEHQSTLKGLNNLGRVYHKQGRLSEAEQTVLSAFTTRRDVLGEKHIDTIRSMIDLGSIYLDEQRTSEAHEILQRAVDYAEEVMGEQHPYTFEALNNLAKVYEAEANIESAIDTREIVMARRSVFLDRMLWVTGENAREGYIRLHKPELDAYLALLARSDNPQRGQKAIEASLQRKGLLLKITSEIEQIAQLSTDPRLGVISRELEATRKELAALTLSGPTLETQGRHPEMLYALERKVNELQGELGRASTRYRTSISGISAQELAASLQTNSSLVDYLMYEEGDGDALVRKVLAGVITNLDGEISYGLIEYANTQAIEKAVLEYRTIIQDDLADEDEIAELGQIAYDEIWLPVTSVIGDLDYVYLIPDGILNILPFNALLDHDDKYLVQTTDLHILTSGRDLLPNDYKLSQGEYVILAGPDYNSENIVSAVELSAAEGRRSRAMQLGIRGAGGGLRGLSFAPLPGAEEEGRIITDRVDAKNETSDVYFGERAQERVLSNITSTPEILHMATHGFFLEADDTLKKRLLKLQRGADLQVPPPGDNPLLRAGLAFAGINSNAQFLGDIDTANDGVLTALEVLGLNLSGTKLVVLSACETGLGEIHEGEGVYGLRRAFQEAGVAEVISSLWEVSDAGTQALMTDFYDRVLSGTSARQALRETQLDLLDSPEWGYPYIWSAFMIVGSYESAGITLQ